MPDEIVSKPKSNYLLWICIVFGLILILFFASLFYFRVIKLPSDKKSTPEQVTTTFYFKGLDAKTKEEIVLDFVILEVKPIFSEAKKKFLGIFGKSKPAEFLGNDYNEVYRGQTKIGSLEEVKLPITNNFYCYAGYKKGEYYLNMLCEAQSIKQCQGEVCEIISLTQNVSRNALESSKIGYLNITTEKVSEDEVKVILTSREGRFRHTCVFLTWSTAFLDVEVIGKEKINIPPEINAIYGYNLEKTILTNESFSFIIKYKIISTMEDWDFIKLIIADKSRDPDNVNEKYFFFSDIIGEDIGAENQIYFIKKI